MTFLGVTFVFFGPCQRFFIGFDYFSLKFWEIQKSKMADQDGRHLTIMTLLPRHMTSPLPVVDVKGDIFVRTYPLIVIAFIVEKLLRVQNTS